MGSPTDNEQLLLEYINYTRLDPLGAASMYISSYSPLTTEDVDIQNALTYFGVSGSALKSALSALNTTQPLAWNGALGTAADGHSAKMIAADEQSHQLSGEASLGSRISSAGYAYTRAGENIYAYADSMLYAYAGFMVDWGFGANGMQDGAGHRVNIMNSTFREVGLGVTQETNTATNVGPWVVTQDFGVRANSPEVLLLGVSYVDNDDNEFYSPGEGRSGMIINASGTAKQSTSSGGYVVEMGAGTQTITFSGGNLTNSLSVSASLSAGTNAKIDVCDQSTLLTSVNLTALSGVSEIRALGIQGLFLNGGAGNQKLVGNSGTNTLNGGAGNDTLIGGAGNDSYHVDNIGDKVYETTTTISGIDAGGLDQVNSALSTYTLGAFIEKGRILNTGTANLAGNTLNNVLYAAKGANILNGSTGIDTVSYQYGLASTTGVTVSLAKTTAQTTGGSSSDTLLGIENLTGSAYADNLTGSTGNNTLDGGTGNDTMIGGTGNDTYYKREIGDVVTESASSGTDTVYSYLTSYTLLANFENGRIVTTAAANLTGNTVNNVLYAGAGNNVLNGGSTTTTDIDTVSYAYGLTGTTGVTVSLAIASGQNTVGLGTDTLTNIENLTGSSYADKLTGNSLANVLDGGAGNDTMIGGTGNDNYVINVLTDVVTELASGGTDTIQSAITYSLVDTDGTGANGGNVENLTLTGSSAINGTGNGLANTITGNGAANILNGGAGNDVLYGGAGNDSLAGGTGSTSADTFVFNTTLSASTNKDTITDFEAAYDTIKLENAIFAKLTATGTLNAGFFNSYASTAAPVTANYGTDGGDSHILYNRTTGALYYDADGTGTASSAVQLAIIGTTTHSALTAADFVVI